MLTAHIMKERYGETCHVMCSPSHYFIVYDNNHFDTLYPNGSIFELDEVFYQYARSAELIGNFNLQPWDGDIYHIVLQCCKRFEVEPLLFSGTVPDGTWEVPEIPKDIAFTLDQFYPVEVSYRTDGERAKVTHVKSLYN
ncbi:hypothetical protein [Vibrio phage pTD1]|uniref:Uncharacterized protein n=1 Tax=Vibrio phage pTD1 TaxID=1938577 RepID=A0A1Q2U325_9CAUD|nr:hypothetical protein FDH33_gp171 [Vibrio phage pTD1]BAW98380.1 hypothetical protein [Vibrio phage pTD1]